MEDFKPNSYKSLEKQKSTDIPDKKIEQVANGKLKKKSEIQKFADAFVSDDIKNIGDYIVRDVLIPNIQTAILDVVTKALKAAFYGESNKKSNSPSSKVSYRSFYEDDSNKKKESSYYRGASNFSYDDITFENRGEAERTLLLMDELIKEYGVVSVGDFYEMAGVPIDGNYTYNNYGWTNISNAKIVRMGEEYLITLPKASPIK